MTPFLRSAFLLAWLAAAAGCGTAESGVGVPLAASHAYTSYDERFSLRYPPDWAEVPRLTLPDDTPFAAASADQRELLVSQKDYETQPPGLEAVLADVRSDYGERLRESGIVALGDRRAVRVVGDAAVAGRPIRLLQYLLLDHARLYYLTLRVPPEAFEGERAGLEAIARSFRLND